MKEIICKICNSKENINSFRSHLRWHHPEYNSDSYAFEFGEFRPKKIKEEISKDESNIKCDICNEKMKNNRQLMYHITKKHKNISKKEYILKYYYNNKKILCKCGCKEEVEIIERGVIKNNKIQYHNDYIKGHWDWIKSGYNTHSDITKNLMHEKAKIRIKKEIEENGVANMHRKDILIFRREKRKNNYLELIEERHDIKILNKDEIETVSSCNNFQYQCNKCLNIWNQKSISPRCIKCNPYEYNNSSIEEKEIQNFLNEYIHTINNLYNIIPKYEIDIFIPQNQIGIEYNGLYWHSEIFKDKNYHINKFNLAENNNIHLIQIFADEWLNKKEIVKSRLLNLIGLTPHKIYARKCKIKEITNNKIKNKFLNDNHIQGECKSKIKLGLYHNDELVSIMTFGKPRKSIGKKKIIKENEWELVRFCNKINTNVIGAASKLLKYFINNYNPNNIFSFADNRWSKTNNNLYTKLGFNLISKSTPGYWYTKNFTERIHRYNFNKGKLQKLGFDTNNKTEHEIMNEIKYFQVWDCGTTRYELNLS